MSAPVKPVIVIAPESATKAVKQTLRRAGYAIVVSDRPEHFNVLDVLPIATGTVIARAAFSTIQDSGNVRLQASFGWRVAVDLLAAMSDGGET